MLKSPFAKPAANHFLAIAIFLVVSVAYFFPILEGKRLYQNDVYQSEGFLQEAKVHHEKTGEYVAWTNSAFSGMPTNYGVSGIARNIFSYIPYGIGQALGYYSFDMLLWLMIGLYILLHVIGISYWINLAGSVIFSLFSFNIIGIEGGHVMKVLQFAMVAPVFAGTILIFRKKYISGGILLLAASAAAYSVNHTQVIYYMMLAVFFIGLSLFIEAIRKKETKHALISGAGIALAFLLAFGANFSMINTMQKASLTTRGNATGLSSTGGKEGLNIGYAMGWSLGISESFTMLVPDYNGGSSTNYFVSDKKSQTFQALRKAPDNETANQLAQYSSAYFGSQAFVSGGYYIGAITCVLFIIGLILMPVTMRAWVLSTFIFFLLLSWGKNFVALYEFFFDYFPLFNKFRVPSMMLGIAQTVMIVSAMWGLDAIIRGVVSREKSLKALKIAGGIVVGFLIISWIMPSVFVGFITDEEAQLPEWFTDALASDRQGLFKADVLRSLGFAVFGIGLLWLFIAGKLKTTVVVALVSAAMIIDVWAVSTRIITAEKFQNTKDRKNVFAMTQTDKIIKQDPDPHYRVFNVATSPFQDALTSYHHKSIGGYHGAKLRRYQELIENQLSKNNFPVLNMLNMKYFIVKSQGRTLPQMNPEAMGNSWFIKDIKMAGSADEEMALLSADSLHNFNPRTTAIISNEFQSAIDGFKPSPDSAAYIRLTEYSPNSITYESNAASPQFAVFSEIHYVQKDGDGWKATIDGTPAEHIRTNYLLRGMKVPAGKHKIEFFYDYTKALTRYKISFGISVVVLALIAALLIIARREKFRAYL